MTNPNIEQLERAVEAQLASEADITPASIRDWVARFRAIFSVSDDDAERLARRFEVRHDVAMRVGSVLVERGFAPWLDAALADIDFFYWERYRRLLGAKHFSRQVIDTMHRETDRILGLLEDPRKLTPWSRRGMVVGHVQSGKTANYIGVIAKAADAGYRLIVVIAGVHNNLRNQTQKRIDEGFVGRDSARLLSQHQERYVGVGRLDATRRPVTFTNSVKDFSKQMATGVGVPLQNLNEPVVFVIKKHASTLKNLVEWLQEHNASRGGGLIEAPMLLIDDEADNASINVRYGSGEVSRINGRIRELLQLFSRSCYVGYTATPFANIFIDPDTDDAMRGEDLFPRHFILSLDPPTNYFGADRVFRTDSKAIVRYIDDNDDTLPLKHPKDVVLNSLPASLIRAVRAFVLGRAIRLWRGETAPHCSMLVNVSRFTDVQARVRGLLESAIADIQASVRVNSGLPSAEARMDAQIGALYASWSEEFASSGASWDDVQARLLPAVTAIRVVEVNSRSHGALNYDDYEDTGLNVIAVGGYSLSRGLTLEGLMVSYFLRNSMMYDTLMQMGRWFGYRDGYDDLCRVWMPEEAEGWYSHIAESIELLREELRLMAAAGATPEEFGLKVRAHPDTLIVTARNKMGSGARIAVRLGLGKTFVETATLWRDAASLEANRNALRTFAADLSRAGLVEKRTKSSGGWLIGNVPARAVRTFVAAFVNHPLSIMTEPVPVSRYIEEREDSELALWDVLVAGLSAGDGEALIDNTFGFPIRCQQRTAGKRSTATVLRVTNKQRVSSRGVERTGVAAASIEEAEREYREESGKPASPSGTWNYPDWIYRAKRTRPLLIVHSLEILERDGRATAREPVVAWSISFPPTLRPEERVEYIVTKTWLQENSWDDRDDDELESDDG